MSYKHCRDEDLLLQLRDNHDPEIADWLMVKYKPLVLSKTRMLFMTGGEHDDLIQEGMLGLFKAIRDYDPKGGAAFSTFASLCIERTIYQAIEKAKRKKNRPLNEAVSMDELENQSLERSLQADPEDILIGEETAGVLKQKIFAELSPFEKTVLDLFLDGKDYREIAAMMHKPSKSIDNALQRIRKKVRTLLSSEKI